MEGNWPQGGVGLAGGIWVRFSGIHMCVRGREQVGGGGSGYLDERDPHDQAPFWGRLVESVDGDNLGIHWEGIVQSSSFRQYVQS